MSKTVQAPKKPSSHAGKWPDHIEGYVVNFLAKNYWRVQRTLEREDCMQVAYVVFLRVRNRYPDVEPKHFTALFKTALSNEFNDLANKDTDERVLVSENQTRNDDGEEFQMEHVGSLDNDGALATMIRQAPQEVLMVLNLFLNAPTELLELAGTAWRRNGHNDAMGRMHVARMLGLPANVDPLEKVAEYFRQER
jgi:hypothetical protein